MGKVETKNSLWLKTEIASTDGIQEIDRINEIESIPIYSLPVGKSEKKNGLMLDIGTASGRWLVSGARKKYIPVGIDVKFDQAQSALRTLRQHGVNGYVVVGDLQYIPFQSNLFDLIWSSQARQYMAHDKFSSCIQHLERIMAKSGKVQLEFPNTNGMVTNVRDGHFENGKSINAIQLNHLSIGEYKEAFKKHFGNVRMSLHSFLGVGHVSKNLKNESFGKKLLLTVSLGLKYFSSVIPALNYFADSVYIKTKKISGPQNTRISYFLRHHWLKQNLNIVYLLQCPISGGPVYLSKDAQYIISDNANVKYPVIDEIPIMLMRAAIPMVRKITGTEDAGYQMPDSGYQIPDAG